MPSNIGIGTILRNLAATFAVAVAAMSAPFVVLASSVGTRAAETQSEPSTTATLQGVVRDSDNRPVAGASVYLQSSDAQTLAGPLTVITDRAGAYRFSAIRQGIYTLRAEATGYHDATVKSLTLAAKEAKKIDLMLESAKASGEQNSSARLPAFFDEPHFTVAGVTDTTSLGGHGSDTVVRNREALARETASLSNAHSDTGDYERARAATRALLAEQTKAGCEQADTHHSLAEADEKLGDSLEAAKEYQRAAELNPSEANLFDWGAELLLHRAAEPAIEVFTKGNRMFPQSVRMLTGLGASWYALGSYEQAARRLCEASDLNPGDPNPYLFMGKMQSSETTQSEAIAERLERFARLQPQNALANYYYAVSLWKGRKSLDGAELAKVKALLEKAVHLDPKLGLAYLQLGILYSERKDFSNAIAAYRHAIEADSRMEEAHYRLAQAYKQAGDPSKVQAELKLYEQISKEKAEETERQRHESQQFVYQMRDPTPSAPQQ